jgi:hypothetical protein
MVVARILKFALKKNFFSEIFWENADLVKIIPLGFKHN